MAGCPSLSGKSTLEYAIGLDASSAIYLQLVSNTGGGYFSAGEWIALSGIERVYGNLTTVTSYPLQSLFQGKSNNNSGFFFGLLKALGIVLVDPDNPRKYLLGDIAAFRASILQKDSKSS